MMKSVAAAPMRTASGKPIKAKVVQAILKQHERDARTMALLEEAKKKIDSEPPIPQSKKAPSK